MDRTFEVTYTPQLIRSATTHFWRRKGGLRDLGIMSVLAAGFIAYVCITGERSVEVGAFGAVLALVFALIVLVYVVYLRRSLAKLSKMDPPIAELRINAEGLAIRSSIGSSEVPWRTIEYVWTFPDVLLVFIGKDNYFTLPIAPMDEETKAFISQMVIQHGGKVR